MRKNVVKANNRLHKAAILPILMLLCVFAFRIDCSAEEYDQQRDVKENIDGILENFSEVIPDGYDTEINTSDIAESIGIKRIIGNIGSSVKGQKTEISSFLLLLLGVGLISALSSLYSSEVSFAASRAVGVVAAAILFDRLYFLLSETGNALAKIGDFFGAVIPISLAVNSLGSSPTTATTQAVGMGITLSIYSFISRRLLIPIVSAIFVSSAASSMDPVFGRIAKGVRDVFLWTMGAFTTLIGATFSLQSVIAASADTTVIRGAKYAISGTIPIVGSTVSGALGLVAGGASYARGIVGGGSVAVVLTVFLSPLITLILHRLCLKLGVFFSSMSSLDGCSGVLSSFLYAMDALIAAYSLTSLIYIVELVAFLKGGGGFV